MALELHCQQILILNEIAVIPGLHQPRSFLNSAKKFPQKPVLNISNYRRWRLSYFNVPSIAAVIPTR